jgi:3'-phosphoadenosine 5'-phosphosulfate sulfotransferase (PAPS reductase)/FAD synthetase
MAGVTKRAPAPHCLGSIAAEKAAGALFVSNHSGGKDSQSMLIHLLAQGVPREQIVVVHASLGRIEWPGALEHAQGQAAAAGLTFIVARAGKSLFDMVRRRRDRRPDVPSWPSASHRQCTSDLKRGPIAREIRRYANTHGFTRIVNCLGFRADESPARRKRPVWSINQSQTNGKRAWIDHLPIHDWTESRVFEVIHEAGQAPHPAYGAGNARLSCVFCIMGSPSDLQNGARLNPALAQEYVALEAETGYTMHMSGRSLSDLLRAPAPSSQSKPANQLCLSL